MEDDKKFVNDTLVEMIDSEHFRLTKKGVSIIVAKIGCVTAVYGISIEKNLCRPLFADVHTDEGRANWKFTFLIGKLCRKGYDCCYFGRQESGTRGNANLDQWRDQLYKMIYDDCAIIGMIDPSVYYVDYRDIKEDMPFDRTFETPSGNEELCHATGREVRQYGRYGTIWWTEYVDSEGNLYYGN